MPSPAVRFKKLHNDALHEVMCALHRTSPIADAALSNDVDRRCNRVAMPLRRAFGICFPAISLVAAWPLLPGTRPVYPARTIGRLLGPFAAIGVLRAIADIWPLARDLGRFQVYAYQQRQPVAAHDLENASTLALHAAGTGPHRKMAGSANRAIAPARGFIAGRFGIEQVLYWSPVHLSIGASGLGGMLAIATMAYQRDLLALAICRQAQQPSV